MNFNKPALTEEEKRIPYAKYYDLPLAYLNEQQQRQVSAPMDPADAIPCGCLLDAFAPTPGPGLKNGYCMMPDGSGYAFMTVELPHCTVDMLDWWFSWFTIPPKNVPVGSGNLRYKIWCPPDHWEHVLVPRPDGRCDVYAEESMDLGAGGPRWKVVHRHLEPAEFGMSADTARRLREAGISFGCSENNSEGLCKRIGMSAKYPREGGGCIARACYWFGWGIGGDGVPYRDLNGKQFDESTVRMILIHNIVENLRLETMLSPLYAEQHEKPLEED